MQKAISQLRRGKEDPEKPSSSTEPESWLWHKLHRDDVRISRELRPVIACVIDRGATETACENVRGGAAGEGGHGPLRRGLSNWQTTPAQWWWRVRLSSPTKVRAWNRKADNRGGLRSSPNIPSCQPQRGRQQADLLQSIGLFPDHRGSSAAPSNRHRRFRVDGGVIYKTPRSAGARIRKLPAGSPTEKTIRENLVILPVLRT